MRQHHRKRVKKTLFQHLVSCIRGPTPPTRPHFTGLHRHCQRRLPTRRQQHYFRRRIMQMGPNQHPPTCLFQLAIPTAALLVILSSQSDVIQNITSALRNGHNTMLSAHAGPVPVPSPGTMAGFLCLAQYFPRHIRPHHISPNFCIPCHSERTGGQKIRRQEAHYGGIPL